MLLALCMCSLEKAPDMPLQERQTSLLARPVIARRANCQLMAANLAAMPNVQRLSYHSPRLTQTLLPFCVPLTAKQKAKGHFYVYVQGYFIYAPALCIMEVPCATPAPP